MEGGETKRIRLSNSRRARRGSITPAIDLAPIIDTVFNLMIFFALSLNFIRSAAIKLELPLARGKVIYEERTVKIYIDADGNVLDERRQTIEDVKGYLESVTGALKSLILRADKRARHGDVVSVMDAAKRAGFSSIAIGVIMK
jgi:biopolymer transport protein ExbD